MATSSCAGFLEEVDQDKLVPTKTEHFAAIMLKECGMGWNGFYNIDIMSDNIDQYSYSPESDRAEMRSTYTWQMEIELNENGKKINTNQAWENTYFDIAMTNYVLEYIDNADGSQQEKEYIKGEAYFLRAYKYFDLVNLYGLPYNSQTSSVDLGVPLRLNSGIEQIYHRATVQECYDQIIADLESALVYIEKSGIEKSKYHPSVKACQLLLSRVYLYTQNWQKAKEYASNIIASTRLVTLNPNVAYVTATCEDVLFSTSVKMVQSELTMYENKWQVSDQLIQLFAPEDLRLKSYFAKPSGMMYELYLPQKRSDSFTSLGGIYLRASEAYLTRAEAKWHLGEDAGEDIRTLLEKRYSDVSKITIATDRDALFQQIMDERRKELCFEEHHRWFDLRRMSKRPQIQHFYTRTDKNGTEMGIELFTLFPDDLNYTLPIPMKERENNPLIRNNERYDKLPQIL